MKTYRALTLWQPWATLVAAGAKQIETRSWTTAYRGPLVIHAAKMFQGWQKQQCYLSPFFAALNAAGLDLGSATNPGGKGSVDDLPRGAIIAVCVLRDCRIIGLELNGTPTYTADDCLSAEPVLGREHAFGDYAPGRYAWLLSDVRALPTPIPARGGQGLWEWAGELPMEVEA